MIRVQGKEVIINHFPDGTLHIELDDFYPGFSMDEVSIMWNYEKEEELSALIYVTYHLREAGYTHIELLMPYLPNARMDRHVRANEVFTLKYFASVINSLNFASVEILDPHSYVGEALFNNLIVVQPRVFIDMTINKITDNNLCVFFPDNGAYKRYSDMVKGIKVKDVFYGLKNRDWDSGEILGLDVIGDKEKLKGKNVLIIDDICSRGGTFYHSAKKLKELGADKIYLYVSHCENTILEGDLLNGDLIEKVFTTNSIFTKEHEKITVMEVEV